MIDMHTEETQVIVHYSETPGICQSPATNSDYSLVNQPPMVAPSIYYHL